MIVIDDISDFTPEQYESLKVTRRREKVSRVAMLTYPEGGSRRSQAYREAFSRWLIENNYRRVRELQPSTLQTNKIGQ